MPRSKNVKKKVPAKSSATSNTHQMEILLNLSKRLAAYENLDEMLQAIVEMVSEEAGAQRGSLFMHDDKTNELYTTYAQGEFSHEIRIIDSTGVAGHVYTTGESQTVHDAYSNDHFDRTSDELTGFKTKSILGVPIKTANGKVIGVVEAINKKKGRFTKKDIALVEAMATQAAIFLQANRYIETMKKARKQEMEFLDVVSDVTSEIDLSVLLQKVMTEAAKMLMAERTTLFLNDEKSNELWSQLGVGLEASQIRFPNHLGIAGVVFGSGNTINIPYAYADLRFNPSFDRETGYFTRSILCTPVVNKNGKIIGVTQALNKQGGPFTDEDESRLKAFTAQVSIALENAKLFDDVQNMKNYNDSILESMSNGVITINEEGTIVTCNAASLRILSLDKDDLINRRAEEVFIGDDGWIYKKIEAVVESQKPDTMMDVSLSLQGHKVSSNLTILPLVSGDEKKLGSMIMIEDITNEKRMKTTMSRYMDPVIADQLLEEGEDILEGQSTHATILFSDIRSFTTLAEELGPQGTVALLNEYFTIMVDCIQQEGGMLDKFIGDAIMAAFGVPVAHDDDEDMAVRAGIAMIRSLNVWNKERINQGKKPVDMGIGLNSDSVVSGNIGSPKRMDYTLIGDGVNLAARLESACKQYFTRILISEHTFKKLRGVYRVRNIDLVQVKGKTEPVGVYEVLDYHTSETFPNLMEVVSYFNDGRSYYRDQKWEKSRASFEKALSLNPDDKLSSMYIERCQHMQANPPGPDWDGVLVMQSK